MKNVSLDDKYTATTGRIYLNGVQALVRLMLVQRQRDAAQGLNTAGFVSGYRGSPLGGLDEALWSAEKHLKQHGVKFLPGLNEELAATAVWGTQQLDLTGGSERDGVFAMWYGKAPGVDRCGDVFKHMAHAGTSRHGGVLLVAGDDHGAYSSTLPNQSDHLFAASMIPMLYPQGVEDYLELGLHGFAMSRFSGLPVGFKALADTVESSGSIEVGDHLRPCVFPEDFVAPDGGLHARLSTDTLGVQARKQEALMQDYKIYAAIAYARANRLNHVTRDAPNARLGIVASGKSYRDMLEALEELGIDEARGAQLGLRLFKVAMPWPLEPDSIREFADGLEEILVVEEKRQIVEYQLKEHLYNWRDDVRPRVIGKFDEQGEWVHPRGRWLLPATTDLSVAQIARVIAQRIGRFHQSEAIRDRLALLDAKDAILRQAVATPTRPAWYCSGCPHNTSTRVPEGSLALAGIGCHVMATAIFPEHNKTTTQMGGEGAPWLGQAWFSRRPHVFANLGDGTYFHSGSLAVRAAVAAGVNITYKILYNDAVAMTGGQPVDGPLTVPRIVQQLAAEGVRRIALVAEEPSRWADRALFPADHALLRFTVSHRDDMDAVQQELREFEGVSVLVYDQVCAAEKRRRRKKGEFPQAASRVVINELVCEGCGDCGVASNCTSLQPLSTQLGLKRTVDQSSCNADLSCIKGFCPSFVTVEGVQPRRPKVVEQGVATAGLPLPAEPVQKRLEGLHNILITGIGGTGVMTVGALIGMAAHLEGKGVSVLDMTGMSQKNGSVTSHVRLAMAPSLLLAQRIPTGEADLILGCDMLTAAAPDAIGRMQPGRTVAVINTHEQPTGHFAQQRDWQYPADALKTLIKDSTGDGAVFLGATQLATALLGDAIATNLFMLGFAFQKGLVPLSSASLLRAIEINGVAVKANQEAFMWGRRAAVDLAVVQRMAAPEQAIVLQRPDTLKALVAHRAEFLTAYQNPRYALEYTRFVERVRELESSTVGGDQLARAVAVNLFKLMAYKDEYEVARLFTDGAFEKRLAEQFEGQGRITFHMAPPLGRRDAHGLPVKQAFGSWMRPVLHALAFFKWLRGSRLDPFGRSAERRGERALILRYRSIVEKLLERLDDLDPETVLALARVPEQIRGYGHVKAKAFAAAEARWQQLLSGVEPTR
ncbi:indolepyruvate ferredoxin oxidoreductase family protein [Hydrogenophaga taeniospiralis]|uniref:indolepyruvate ferredoxin oxidoreductase family protein n=1 Tax=Hydrogenophaga taeniospiralis TaxID=65656 RepID=UPI001CF990AC|nr:indolepyruvate ferredoxin oxidoreductase family protein [Hydrogenophaga taeniospiralis]MCB4365509.1 indolepyruvate ferredoxin oxidoreductase family protein [Hydrogenophaga taeniospiralis]